MTIVVRGYKTELDLNFGEIRRQITSKAERYGSRVITVNRFYPSSKTCSGCGYIKPELALSERTIVCECCGFVIDRDLNAAINLRNEAVCTASSAGSHACGAGGSGSLATESETARVEAGTNPHLGLS